MTKRRIVLALVICLSVAAFAGQSFYRTQGHPEGVPDWVIQAQRLDPNERQEYVASIMQKQRELREKEEQQWRKQLEKQRQKERAKAQDEAMKHLSTGRRNSHTQRTGQDKDSNSTPANETTLPKDAGTKETHRGSQYTFSWSRPSARKSPSELTRGERVCEELLDLLEDQNATLEEIQQKVETLRDVRRDANRELAKARKELREVLNLDQEATLLTMGWL
ncbi:MAG: hypothetical protein AMJ75_03220 [Phycisphaerae bacterium SM1_79]|nr:MAG: hypothetical protein AMJ75_03220 [Phycisphaerae bacterium SM1_79]